MEPLTTERIETIVRTVLPGHRLVSSTRASTSFTNDAMILECATPAGNRIKLAVKLLVDNPASAPRSAVASYQAMLLAKKHGVPVPEPVYLDETGETLGMDELHRRNPRTPKGHRPAKHHQWLTEDVGHPALAQHLYAVIGLMRLSPDWKTFMDFLDRAYPKRDKTIPFPLDTLALPPR
jgi:hypothetical protein